jgi:hypothetical protein
LSALSDVFPGVPLVESPLFTAFVDDLQLSAEERRVALDLHDRGFAVIDFQDDQLEERIDRIKAFVASRFELDFSDAQSVKGSGHRLQDAWVYCEDIRAIACNQAVLELLGKLYGRRPFPFQTLNFPVGTAQPLHSDSIHFSSIPERFMCGVWLAMEDVHADAGPLTYLPGSHKWPILSNAMIGRQGFDAPRDRAQQPFEAAWEALVEHSGAEQEVFLARKGQALIWSANLLHGGAVVNDPTRTRWSQVTHFYFDDCIYYTPSFSDEALGLLDLRTTLDVSTEARKPSLYFGQPVASREPAAAKTSVVTKIRRRLKRPRGLPADFDADTYHRLNPDVSAARLDAAAHYLTHGKAEGRRYRLRSG